MTKIHLKRDAKKKFDLKIKIFAIFKSLDNPSHKYNRHLLNPKYSFEANYRMLKIISGDEYGFYEFFFTNENYNPDLYLTCDEKYKTDSLF